MRPLTFNFILAPILCAFGGLVILVGHVGQLHLYTTSSPYVAAALCLGTAIGLVFGMIIILIDSHETKLKVGAHFVVYERDEG